jgi:hypothetical protein
MFMKRTFILLVLFLGIINLEIFAQSVNCSKTYLTTIQTFDVYKHDASGAIMFKAKMAIDADGSPRAYGPSNSGLDYTANAGSPGNWWGVVTDNNGNPIIQGSGDPYPGMYVSTTSLVNSAYSSTNPLRYTDSENIPFFVLPHAVVVAGGITIGDIGYVYNTMTGLGCYAVYADGGPAGKLGEGSIYLASQIGVYSNARTGGTTQGIIDYIVFPGSGAGQGTIPSITQINSIGTTQLNAAGGTGLTGCIGTSASCGTPSNLIASAVTPTSEELNWDVVSGATSYNIQYKESGSSTWTTVTSTAASIDVDGLLASATYQFKVQAMCSVAGNYSSTETFNTLENIAPTTAITVPGNWATGNFTATFTDADNNGGSGLEKRYYQVLDYDGAEWHANSANGFFADNFDSYNSSVWSVPSGSGTWQVANGNLIQQDTSVNNSNIYSSLNQNLSNRYMYQFYAMMDPATSGSSQHRFGLHFFSDNASLSNRGNSYFMYVRQETSVIEIYKVINNAFTLMHTINDVATVLGQWYDYKIIFDRISGKINIYREDAFLGTWTDGSVLNTSGDYVSFRTGNCKAYISEFKVYRSRAASVAVSVGAGAANDIRYQNPSPSVYSGKIKSIVNDSAGNISSISYQNINVDWTEPSCEGVIDGLISDADTTNSLNTLAASWAVSADSNSGINNYFYAIGTSAGATDVLGWTDNSQSTSCTAIGLGLSVGQTYYVSVKVVNGAGLSSICNTDGIAVSETVNAGIEEKTDMISLSAIPNPFNEAVTLYFSHYSQQKVELTLTDIFGRIVMNANGVYAAGNNSISINADELKLAKGAYTLRVVSGNSAASLKLIKY